MKCRFCPAVIERSEMRKHELSHIADGYFVGIGVLTEKGLATMNYLRQARISSVLSDVRSCEPNFNEMWLNFEKMYDSFYE